MRKSPKLATAQMSLHRYVVDHQVHPMDVVQDCKKKEILTQAKTWVKLDDLMLCDISRTKRQHCIMPLGWVPRIVRFIETQSRIVIIRAWSWGLLSVLSFISMVGSGRAPWFLAPSAPILGYTKTRQRPPSKFTTVSFF